MFGGSPPAQRFLEVIGNVRTDKYTFAISHLGSPYLPFGRDLTLQLRNRSVSRILYFDKSKWRSFI